jgi:aminoglycoside N3'-acetyltransferase
MVPLSPQDLARDLRALGVVPGDTIMVHASLRSVGPVAGGGRGVVLALDEAVGPDGTLLMGIGARDDWSWVNGRPEPERPGLLAEAVPFDYLVTPADPDIGVLAEVFRQTPGTLVSDHPEGRFAARGRMASQFLSDVPWDDYYGPGSPLERLVDAGGKVLRLGADPDTVTLIHYAEYLAEVADKRRVRRYRRVAAPDGPVIRVVECLDDSDGIVESPDDYFERILDDFLESCPARRGRVGNSRSELLDAPALVAFAVAWLSEHLTAKG